MKRRDAARCSFTTAPCSRSRKLEKGEAVYTQGDRGDTFYVVLEGTAVFQRVQEGGGDRAVTVRTANRGVGFGEQALLTGSARETSVIATAPMEVLQIDKAVFLSTCQQQMIQKNRRCKELLCQVPCFKRFDQS
jgi:CRP-like cAMP-binding protein